MKTRTPFLGKGIVLVKLSINYVNGNMHNFILSECPLEWKLDGRDQKGCANPDGRAGSWCPTADGYNPSTLEYIDGTGSYERCNCTSENGSTHNTSLIYHVL